MADLPIRYREHYQTLIDRYFKDTDVDFTRNECCKDNSEHQYSIPDWFQGGHYFCEECQVCGKEWWMDEMELWTICGSPDDEEEGEYG